MNYPQALQFIHSLDRFGIRPGLQRIQALCRALGDPQERLQFVHVGGTNGKGSVSTMLSEMLRAEGKRVGLFTSPYVTHFLERIQVGGKPVEEAAFAETVTRLEPIVNRLAAQDRQPTEFEVITAAAFDLFAAEHCDVVVLEVGLGGRLDSTNVIDTPLVSVITSISLDHMAILGDTVEQIAAEKAGIIKPNGRTVCYPDQPGGVMDVIRAACIDKQNSFTVPELAAVQTVQNDLFGTRFFYEGTEYETAMGGVHQIKNAVTAIEAARLLGVSLPSVQVGLKRAKLAARQEVICRKPLVLLDGGHNEDGGRVLAESLKQAGLTGKTVAVLGMMADKSIDEYLKAVAPLCRAIFTVPVANNARAQSAEALKTMAEKYCPDVTACGDACKAIDLAKVERNDGECLLVCGSLYLAGEVRAHLIKNFSG